MPKEEIFCSINQLFWKIYCILLGKKKRGNLLKPKEKWIAVKAQCNMETKRIKNSLIE